MKLSNLQIVAISAVALILAMALIGILTATAAEVVVIRDLPDDPVYPEDVINVSLTQSGFFTLGGGGIGIVTETLPEGLGYHGLQEGYLYNETTNVLRITFENKVTMTYRIKAGTADDIENAVFSGTWETIDAQTTKIYGDVTGDDSLTRGTTTLKLAAPTLTPLGKLSLIGVFSIVLALSIRRKRR